MSDPFTGDSTSAPTPTPTPTLSPAMSAADVAAHEAASYVRTKPARTLTTYTRRDVRNTVARIREW